MARTDIESKEFNKEKIYRIGTEKDRLKKTGKIWVERKKNDNVWKDGEWKK